MRDGKSRFIALESLLCEGEKMREMITKLSVKGIKSPGYKMDLAYLALLHEIEQKNADGVRKNLGGLQKDARKIIRQYVLMDIISLDWPEGLDMIMEHLNLKKEGIYNFSDVGEGAVLSTMIGKKAFKLVEHIWASRTEEEKAHCIEKHLSFDLARVLVKVGSSKVLETLELPQQTRVSSALRRILSQSVQHVCEALPQGGKKKRLSQKEQKELVVVEEIIRRLLARSDEQFLGKFWETVCLEDNDRMLKRLVKTGVIGEKIVRPRMAPKTLLTHKTLEEQSRIPGWWLEKKDESAYKVWQQEGQEAYQFNLSEILCLYSSGCLRILGQAVLQKKFREELMGSAVARHACVEGISLSLWGGGVYEELKAQGEDLTLLVGDAGQSPLHVAVRAFNGTEDDRLTLKELMKVHPEWIKAKDTNGVGVVAYAKSEVADEVASIIESVEIKGVVESVLGEAPMSVDYKEGIRTNTNASEAKVVSVNGDETSKSKRFAL